MVWFPCFFDVYNVFFQFGSSIPPKEYQPILSKVLLCEGGNNGPLISFMSWMVKSYGENSFLGSEFTTSLVDIVIDKSNLYTMVRVGLVITNLCHEKKVDGVAKLITKTDIKGLTSSKIKLVLQECELFLTRAWKQCEASSLPVTFNWKVLGQAMIRTVLMLVKKEKLGREGKEYKMSDIQGMFAKGMAGEETTESKAASSKDQPALDLDQGHTPMFLAKKQLDLKIGSTYTVQEFPNRLWTVTKLTDSEVELAWSPLLEPSKKTILTYKDHEIATKLKPSKARVPQLFDTNELDQLFPHNSDDVADECTRAQIFLLLQEAYNKMDLDTDEIIVQSIPKMAIYAKKDFGKKKCKLIPVPEKVHQLMKKLPQSNTKYGEVQFAGETWYIGGLRPLKIPKDDDPPQKVSGVFAPFWYALTKEEEGNLKEEWVTYKGSSGDLKIKVLTNNDEILKHDMLALVKGESPPEGPAAKRAKK